MTKSCVVTGGAGTLGRGISARLLAEGWGVVSLDLHESPRPSGIGADAAAFRSVLGDVSTPGAHAVAAAAASELGELRGWVNCAGYNILGSVVEVGEDELARGVAVNLLGVFHGTAAACRHLLDLPDDEPRGAIVNISSIQAAVGFPGFAAYAMTKGGIESLTRQVAAEYVARGIRCNAVAPGLITSEMNERLLAASDDPGSILEAWRAITPIGRWGTAADIAAAVSFLLGDDASFITGEVLAVNGGALAVAPGQARS